MFNVEELKRQVYRCTRCGWCRASPNIVCPVYESDIPFEHNAARGKIALARGVIEGQLQLTDELVRDAFTCTSCGNCQEHCLSYHPYKTGALTGEPVIDPVETIELFKNYVVEHEGALPIHKEIHDCVKQEGNPFGEPASKRTDCLAEFKLKKEADVVYFVGCMSSYRLQSIAKSTARLLQKLDVNFTILENEVCCGSVLLRTGQSKEVTELMKSNLEQIQSTGATKVVFSCPGCFMTISRDYPKFGSDLEFEPIHLSEFLSGHLGQLEIKQSGTKTTYHDPCHLGRARKIYDAPREIMQTVYPNFVELNTNKELARCCGAGGGMRSAYPEISEKIASTRLEDIKNSGVQHIVSACPFCEFQFIEMAEKEGLNLDVKDIAEVLLENLQ
ncbi:MAG: (Fe-S)-binding protein [Candidatus Thorarchaeota archaeon]|jgi:heterodisulfide reductase subunit D